MSDNEIGDNGLEGLAHALRRNSTVKLLELCFNRITAAGAESFSKAIWGCKTLRSLRLDNNQVGISDCSCDFAVSRGPVNLCSDGKCHNFLGCEVLYHRHMFQTRKHVRKCGNNGRFLRALLEELFQTDGLRLFRDMFMSNEDGSNSTRIYHPYHISGMASLLCFFFSCYYWQLGDRGAHALASALPSLALQTLELGFNNIGALGVAALMQVRA